jgi:hypothetical protein
MAKVIPIAYTLLSVAFVLFAVSFIFNFEPANPIIPLAACFAGGVCFRQAFD